MIFIIIPMIAIETIAVTVYENNPISINTAQETKAAKQAFNNENRHALV